MSKEFDEYPASDPETGIIVPDRKLDVALVARTPFEGLAMYPGIGSKAFTKEQQEVIERAIDPNDVDILPTGEIYYSQVQYRKRLNEAFGPGGWGLVPIGQFIQDGDTLVREYALIVEGRVVATALGESDYQPENARMSKATTAEAVKSIAIRRLCKDLGIADECWDKRFIQAWKVTYAVRVWTVGVGSNNKGQKKPLWRRKDAEAFDFPWREGSEAPAPRPVRAPDDPQAPPVLDPDKKWKEFAAKATAKDKSRFLQILGAHGFEKPEEVTDRATRVLIFKAWEGEEDA